MSLKKTRKREFLEQMERVVPWAALVTLIAPYYPKGHIGRPPFALETMLRTHFLQQWFGPSDPAMEEAFFDVPLYREFARLDAHGRLPDESTILRFRHRLEKHKLADAILMAVNDLLGEQGLLLRQGSAVDATLIAAPSSTKKDPRKALARRGCLYAGRLRLQVAPDRSAKSLESFVSDSVQPGTHITTDDWSGYVQLAQKGYQLTQVAQRGDPDIAEKHLPLVHLVFGNLKTWLNGIHHGVSPQHLQAYLNEFTFRFNRRFFPFNAFHSLLDIGAATEPTTYAALYNSGSPSKLFRNPPIGN